MWPFAALWGIAAGLVMVFWIGTQIDSPSYAASWYRDFVNLNGEGNLPAWYSSTLWLIAAALAWLTGRAERRYGRSARLALYWFALGAGCVLLSLDESASIHEGLGALIDHRTGNPEGYAPVYSWVWLAIGVVALAFAVFIPFLLALPKATAIGLLVSGGVFLSGAMGMETIGSLVEYGTLTQWPLGLSWNREFVAEEFLEMSGVILLAATIRWHLHVIAKPTEA